MRWTHRLLHYGGSSASGGIFIGSPGGIASDPKSYDNHMNDMHNNNNNSTGMNTGMSDDNSNSVDILNVFMLLLGGFAIVFGIIIATYIVSIVMDKYCCCFPGFVAVGSLGEVDQGPVARKAGLWGLRLSERQQVLQKVFAEKQIVYHARQVVAPDVDIVLSSNMTLKDNEGADEEAPQLVAENEIEQDAAKGQDKPTPEKNEPKQDDYDEMDIEQGDSLSPINDDDDVEGAEQKTAVKEEPEDSKDDADHERVCCICLGEYEEGCSLLTGSSCVHKFHYDCSMVWLLRHDDCPYCRNHLVSPKDFREAALQVLGQGRIKELDYSRRTQGGPVVAAAAITTITSIVESLQTNDETEHDSQQDTIATPDEGVVVDLEAGEQFVDGEVELVAIAEPDEAGKAEAEEEMKVTTKPTDDGTTEPDLEVGADGVHDSKSGTEEEAAPSE
jgi:hypothetical protein